MVGTALVHGRAQRSAPTAAPLQQALEARTPPARGSRGVAHCPQRTLGLAGWRWRPGAAGSRHSPNAGAYRRIRGDPMHPDECCSRVSGYQGQRGAHCGGAWLRSGAWARFAARRCPMSHLQYCKTRRTASGCCTICAPAAAAAAAAAHPCRSLQLLPYPDLSRSSAR